MVRIGGWRRRCMGVEDADLSAGPAICRWERVATDVGRADNGWQVPAIVERGVRSDSRAWGSAERTGEANGCGFLYAGVMTRITIEVPDEVAERMNAAAAARGVATEQLVGEVAAEQFPPRRKLGFIGIGSSGEGGGDIARRHREIIGERFAGKTARDA